MTLVHFEGCLLGLALGDALGARHEGGIAERVLWRLIGTTRHSQMRWTDDTQMSLDIAESLAATGTLDPDDLAARFARSYRWSRGYGPGVAKLLKRIAHGADWRQANRAVFSEGSFGNGGAMRAPVIGMFYCRNPDKLADAARLAAMVTHAHPLGKEGAVLLACATAQALDSQQPYEILRSAAAHCKLEPFTVRLEIAAQWLHAGEEPGAREVARRLGNGVAASESCVTAVYLALRFMGRPFMEMLVFIAKVGGDVDTLGAMAGAVWGAANGVAGLPQDQLARLEQRERLTAAAAALHARVF